MLLLEDYQLSRMASSVIDSWHILKQASLPLILKPPSQQQTSERLVQ